MDLPKIYTVHQQFEDTSIKDVAGTVRKEFSKFNPGEKIKNGQSVAVGVASRGTHDLKILVKTTIDCLKEMGLKPFVIPAMGSHGGGTGEGQEEVLKDLGISKEQVGAEIVSSMDVVSLGKIQAGAEVFMAKDAILADHIVVINRVKPHTAFRSDVESGLCKILAVGCGRQIGAENMHRYDLAKTIVPAAELIMEKTPVLCGLAVTENAMGGTHSLKLANPEEFADVDREFLKTAWEIFPKLPLDDLDVLIVDEIGKNVSGAGMDPNVVGFWRREGGVRKPDYRVLVTLDLTPQSHGNATGLGFVDLPSKRLISMVDWQATYLNSLTCGVFRASRMPIPLENDLEVVETAVSRTPAMEKIRLARIVNTGSLETFWVSKELIPELQAKKGIDVEKEALDFGFDESGRILPMH